MTRLWDVQWGENWWVSLGVHVDHTDPSVTLHLPGVVLSAGRCKQPGFQHGLRRTFRTEAGSAPASPIRLTLPHRGFERDAIVSMRVESVLALPIFTLVRMGLRPPSGRIQGGIFYRVGDGLGPVSRDQTARDVLWREAGSWVQHEWPWGFDVLATPGDAS